MLTTLEQTLKRFLYTLTFARGCRSLWIRY